MPVVTPVVPSEVVALTGGVGAGKSTVLRYLQEECGAFVIQCDQVAAELQRKGAPCYDDMCRLFGPGVLREDGEFARDKIASLVFNDSLLSTR